MPRFFSSGKSWIDQVPIIFDYGDLNCDLKNLVITEIESLIKTEQMKVSLLSRVVTITARRYEFAQTSYLTLRLNVVNGDPVQFGYRIVNDGNKFTITRDKEADNQGIKA